MLGGWGNSSKASTVHWGAAEMHRSARARSVGDAMVHFAKAQARYILCASAWVLLSYIAKFCLILTDEQTRPHNCRRKFIAQRNSNSQAHRASRVFLA
jgi:hypothetical protein